jgi:MFS family permease
MTRKFKLSLGLQILIISFFTLFISYGIRNSFSVFYSPVGNEFGWSRSLTGIIPGITILCYGLAATFVGIIADKIGAWRIMPIGVVLISAGCLISSQATELWHLYLFFGVFIGIGSCIVGWTPHTSILANTFHRNLGLIFGIAASGVGLSNLVSIFAQFVTVQIDWRASLIVLGIASFVILMPLVLLQRKKLSPQVHIPMQKGTHEEINQQSPSQIQHWALNTAIKTSRFWFLVIAFFSLFGGNLLILSHQVNMVLDMGYSKMFAASIYGLYGIFIAAGQICSLISDRIGRVNTIIICTICMVAGIVSLMFLGWFKQDWMLYAFIFLFGFFMGIANPTLSAIGADLFKGKGYASIQGFLVMSCSLSGAATPALAGLIHDTTGSYFWALIIVIAGTILACIFSWLAVPRKDIHNKHILDIQAK